MLCYEYTGKGIGVKGIPHYKKGREYRRTGGKEMRREKKREEVEHCYIYEEWSLVPYFEGK